MAVLKIKYTSKVLSYDDVATPTKLTDKKMLPITLLDNGKSLNESLDIIKYFDTSNVLFNSVDVKDLNLIEDILNNISACMHPLAMPAWLKTPEFDEPSRQYFLNSKQKKESFSELVRNEESLKKDLSEF